MTETILPNECADLTLYHQGLVRPLLDPSQAIQTLVAVQSQYHESLLLSLWARCPSLTQEQAEDLLWDKKEWIKTWSFRWTLHGFHQEDWALITAAVGQEHNQRIMSHFNRGFGVDKKELDAMNGAFMEILRSGPKTRKEMDPHLEQVRFVGKAWGTDMKSAAILGLLVCAGGTGANARFASRFQWLPDLKWPKIDAFEAKKQLLRRYLRGYAPATMQDFSYWSALPLSDTRKAFEAIQNETVCCSMPSSPNHLYMLYDQTKKSNLGPNPSCTLLPKFDALLIGYKDRTRFISQANYKKIHRPAGHLEAIYLLNGAIAGTWRKKASEKKIQIALYPFQRHTKNEQSILREGFERLGSFLKAPVGAVTFSQ